MESNQNENVYYTYLDNETADNATKGDVFYESFSGESKTAIVCLILE